MHLTEERIFPIAQGMPTHWTLSITDENNSRESCEQLKQQILSNQEKAEHYDSVLRLSHEINQENKQLKESKRDLISECNFKISLREDEIQELQEKLEKIKSNFNELELADFTDFLHDEFLEEVKQ